MFKIYFDEFSVNDEPVETPAEKPAEKVAESDISPKQLTEAEFGALSETEQNEFFAKSIEQNFAILSNNKDGWKLLFEYNIDGKAAKVPKML